MVANLVLPTPEEPLNSNEIHLFSLYPNLILLVMFINLFIASSWPIIFPFNSFSMLSITFLLSFNISYIGMFVLLLMTLAISSILTTAFSILSFMFLLNSVSLILYSYAFLMLFSLMYNYFLFLMSFRFDCSLI